VIEPKTHIGESVLVAQRAFLQNAWMGVGANAQENCCIINSRLEGFNVTAHGAKIIYTDLGQNIFVGFTLFASQGQEMGQSLAVQRRYPAHMPGYTG